MKTTIVTPDIYFCAALLSLGLEIEDVDKSDPKHIRFTLYRKSIPFKSENLPIVPELIMYAPSLEEYELQWANETLIVNGAKYAKALQRIKTIIHAR